VLPTLQPAYYFVGNATYVIAGGLGGLGRSIVKWMADRKARHFLLLSRSGADGSSTARDFIEEMKARGVHILAPRCDVTDEQTVAAVIRECNQNMPPIKGCIQGSMVLKASLLPLPLARKL
jgi:NAD(P)-dependent dehydrogenase (short-subunit alcohol dehydrogenase family)